MSKKIKNRILILIVGSIWGYNGYKYYRNYKAGQDLEETEQSYTHSSFSPVMFSKDSFDLDIPDVDPFLKRQSRSNHQERNVSVSTNNNTNQHRAHTKPKVEVPKTKVWPSIKYLGFVKNHQSTEALCLLKIDGSLNKVSQGDEKKGVIVTSVFRDSIQLQFEGEYKTIIKG